MALPLHTLDKLLKPGGEFPVQEHVGVDQHGDLDDRHSQIFARRADLTAARIATIVTAA